jgi:hypothetical protein
MLMLLSLLIYLKAKLIALPYLIVVVYRYLLEYLKTTTFMVKHNFKVIPSARCTPAANAICKDIDVFSKDYIFWYFITMNLDFPSWALFCGFHIVHFTVSFVLFYGMHFLYLLHLYLM